MPQQTKIMFPHQEITFRDCDSSKIPKISTIRKAYKNKSLKSLPCNEKNLIDEIREVYEQKGWKIKGNFCFSLSSRCEVECSMGHSIFVSFKTFELKGQEACPECHKLYRETGLNDFGNDVKQPKKSYLPKAKEITIRPVNYSLLDRGHRRPRSTLQEEELPVEQEDEEEEESIEDYGDECLDEEN